MTRRERLERKAELRRDWADKRRSKASAEFAKGDPYRGDVAFNTQPGHIPERARVIAAADRGHVHAQMASHHNSKADGLERALERSIFSDDEDAIAQLESRMDELTRIAEHNTMVNAAYRKAKGESPAEKLGHLVGTGQITEQEALKLAKDFAVCPYNKQPYPSYVNANLRKRIATDRDRIKTIRARAEKVTEAEAAGGVTIVDRNGYTWVTYAEKPDRSVIEALKAADYRWSNGSWIGDTAKLPDVVREGAGEVVESVKDQCACDHALAVHTDDGAMRCTVDGCACGFYLRKEVVERGTVDGDQGRRA